MINKELLNELKTFDETLYGLELSARDCREIADYIETLEKALDIACEELVDSSKYDTEAKVYFKNGKVRYACNMTKQEWKEYLLSEVDE